MEDVKKGKVPKEIALKFKDLRRQVSLALSDQHETTFKPPPPPYVPFSGQAVSLGGGAAGLISAVATKAVDLLNEQNKPVVNPTKPTTQVSIRLHNGQ